MHELAITQSVIDAVRSQLGDVQVRRVCMEIGRLSGVVAESVRFCFDLIAVGTPLEGAVLEIVQPSGRARCRDCRAEFALDDLLVLCACGSADREVLSGDQLKIREVEVLA